MDAPDTALHGQDMPVVGRLYMTFEQCSSVRRVAGLTGRERERYGCSSIRGNHMNLGCPSSAGFADGLRSIFLTHRCRQDEPSRSCYPAIPLQSERG